MPAVGALPMVVVQAVIYRSIRAVRQPLPMCKAEVENTYASRSEQAPCVNPEFGELPVGEPTFRVIAQIKAD